MYLTSHYRFEIYSIQNIINKGPNSIMYSFTCTISTSKVNVKKQQFKAENDIIKSFFLSPKKF